MSKGEGAFYFYINYRENNKIQTKLLDKFNFENTKTTLSIDIDKLLSRHEREFCEIQTFSVVYSANSHNKVPTRVNMQLIYGSIYETNIDSSINVSLSNNDLFIPEGKGSHSWIQVVNSKEYILEYPFH